MIELKNVWKTYSISKKEQVQAIKNISLTLPNRGMIFITGKSGSGKSTLLNLLGLLDNPDEGQILVDGMDVSKFKSSEVDSFRNTFVGFVFQEYNLIDNFNVYDNVEIVLDLQGKNKSKELVNNALDMVGISELAQRKINELSGGQKQRVALARTIAKDAKMILADEPTGNLDSENSEQVFSILKTLSKDRLVVVVTHDVELANKYGDRVLELYDGVFLQDVSKVGLDAHFEVVNFVKSKLSLLKSLKLSFGFLNKKRLKIIVIIFLIALCLTSFGFTYLLTEFNINKVHAETMVEKNESRVEIVKKIVGKNFSSDSAVVTFTEDEVLEVSDMLDMKFTKVYRAVENNSYLSFFNTAFNYDSELIPYAYYDLTPDDVIFLEYSDNDFSQLKIIGEKPINANEVIISKVFADYIIKMGVNVRKFDANGYPIIEKVYPKDYNDLINSKNKIVLGTSFIVVSGITDDDLTKYEYLKDTLSADMDITPTEDYIEFITKHKSRISEVIVANNFFETFPIKDNNRVEYEFYRISYNYKGKKIYDNNISLLTNRIKYFNGITDIETDNIGVNEIVMGPELFNELYGDDYNKKVIELKNKLMADYYEAVKIREENIKKNKELGYQYEEIAPVTKPDLYAVEKQFRRQYIIDKKIIGSNIPLTINDLYLRTQDEKTKDFGEYTIIGFCEDCLDTYYSKDSVFKDYMRDNFEVFSIYFDESNEQKLEEIFDRFPEADAKYISKSIYSGIILAVKQVVKKIAVVAKYVSILLLVFLIVLFFYFMITSVESNRKDIGILRSLGAKISDIYKIFYLESFILGIFALGLSSLGCYFSVKFVNNIISTNLFIDIKPIMFKNEIVLILFVLLILLITLSFGLPVLKISKIKPIDSISEK